MPIIRVEGDEIEVACAACGADRKLAICDVVVQTNEQDASRLRLELPPCARCRSVETLIPITRAGERPLEPQGHAMLVDLVAAKCGSAEMTDELADEIAVSYPDSIPQAPSRTAK